MIRLLFSLLCCKDCEGEEEGEDWEDEEGEEGEGEECEEGEDGEVKLKLSLVCSNLWDEKELLKLFWVLVEIVLKLMFLTNCCWILFRRLTLLPRFGRITCLKFVFWNVLREILTIFNTEVFKVKILKFRSF